MIIQAASSSSQSSPSQEAPTLVRASGDTLKATAGAGVEIRRDPTVEGATRPNAAQQASPEQLKAAVKEINRAMQQSNLDLEFSVDTDSHTVVVKMTDKETGELIRQIPSDETLAISRSIGEFQQGMLLRQTA